MDVVPGPGHRLHRARRTCCCWCSALYVAASRLLAGCRATCSPASCSAPSTGCASDVEDKLNRLPLPYFDRQPRGELLSRVTNDIDNIRRRLQQTLSQLLTSLLTVIGVLVMMFWISPLLALIALVTIPLSRSLVTALIAKRSQKLFIAQWTHTGALNGQIEEAFTGHDAGQGVRPPAARSRQTFAEKNEELYEASFGAQFVCGIIMPAMMFIGNLNYVVIAVVGGLRVASGALSLGDVQAFIQYSRQFTQPLTQVASMANLLQSGVASAERVFELLDAEEQVRDAAEPARVSRRRTAGSRSSTSRSATTRDKPLIDDLSLVAEPGQTVAIVGPTGAGKTTLVNLIMRFYELDGGRITLDGVDIAQMTRARPARPRSAWCCRTPGCSAARSATTSPTAARTRREEEILDGGGGDVRRPVRAQPARRLRHGDRRGGQQHQRRREAAASRSRGRSSPTRRC